MKFGNRIIVLNLYISLIIVMVSKQLQKQLRNQVIYKTQSNEVTKRTDFEIRLFQADGEH